MSWRFPNVTLSTGTNSSRTLGKVCCHERNTRHCLVGKVSQGLNGSFYYSMCHLVLYRNQVEKTVVIKAVKGHPRVENERDVLRRFQHRAPHLRPLIDEIEEPADPPAIVLKYLDDHLLNASIYKPLNRKELKYVSRRILEALKVLHRDGYVHTGKSFMRSSSCATLNPRYQMSNLTMYS